MGSQAKSPKIPGTIYIVDDDSHMRSRLANIVELAGWSAMLFDSGTRFLKQVREVHPACVILDLLMPDMSGLEVQKQLKARSIRMPVILQACEGSVSIATQAILEGAVDFLVKPIIPDVLVLRLRQALELDERRMALATIQEVVAALTQREREVCQLLVRGLGSKQIAQQLGLSVRTVEHHRERVLRKTNCPNATALASLLLGARLHWESLELTDAQGA